MKLSDEKKLEKLTGEIFKILSHMEYPGTKIQGLWSLDRSCYPNAFRLEVGGKRYWVDVTDDPVSDDE